VGRVSAHYIALTRPAKSITKFRLILSMKMAFFTVTASEGRVFLRSVNAARNLKSSNVRNRPGPESFSPAIYFSWGRVG
jgi:hypothetical protein